MENVLHTILMILICVLSLDPDNTMSASTPSKHKKPETRELADVIGITHVAGKYHLNKEDFLNEGANQILALGSRVIKVWFFCGGANCPRKSYPFNSNWPQVNSLVEGAKLPYFKTLFDKPFTAYILGVVSLGRRGDYWRNGITEKQKCDEQRQFYELAKHFLTTYRNTGKTFILQHWEGDWLIRRNFNAKTDPSPSAIKNMIEWLNARQAGVTKARREVGQNGVRVYHAAEVNLVVKSMQENRPNLINKVIPYTKVDLVSYSAWDSVVKGYENPKLLRQALNFIAANTPDHPDFGDKNVYLGEFGIPENNFTAEQVLKSITNAVETALDWGCPWIVYWQLYCNELNNKNASIPVHSNDDVRGFWLIRPDGSKSQVWNYFYRMLHNYYTNNALYSAQPGKIIPDGYKSASFAARMVSDLKKSSASKEKMFPCQALSDPRCLSIQKPGGSNYMPAAHVVFCYSLSGFRN